MTHTVPFEYDPEADAAYIELTAGPTDYSLDLEAATEGRPILLSIKDGYVVGIEILNARAVLGPELTRGR